MKLNFNLEYSVKFAEPVLLSSIASPWLNVVCLNFSDTNVPFEVNHSVSPLRASTIDTFAKAAVEKKLIVLRLFSTFHPYKSLK